jgi:hypothetical protein
MNGAQLVPRPLKIPDACSHCVGVLKTHDPFDKQQAPPVT